MDYKLQIILTIISSVLASSGLWAFITYKLEAKDMRTQMLKGLAHDRIMYLGTVYIERGWITGDEYENLNDYLYTPYLGIGGNGTAEKIMDEVKKLPIRKISIKGMKAEDRNEIF